MCDKPVGESMQDEPAWPAAAAVMASDHEVEAVLVCVADEIVGGFICFAFDDHLLNGDAGAAGAVADAQEALLEVGAGRIDRFAAVLFGFGVAGRMGDRRGDDLGVVATGELDR